MDKLRPRMCVKSDTPKEDFKMEIVFHAGENRTVDLTPYLQGPIFKPVREDPEAFKRVKVVGGTVAWESRGDIDPDVLYYNLQPAWQAQTETG